MPLFKVGNFEQIGASFVEKPQLRKVKHRLPDAATLTFSTDAISEVSYKLQIPKLDLVKSQNKWGLYLKKLTLYKSFIFFLANFLGKKNDIYLTSFAWDYSGNSPIVYPPPATDASAFVIPMKKNETRKFIGDGVAIWPPQHVVGALNVVIIVYECDKNIRMLGQRLVDIHEAVSKSRLASLLVAISSAPALAAGIAVGNAVSELVGVIGKIMKNDQDDYVDLFEGSYGTDKQQTSRKEKYDQDAAGIELELSISRHRTPKPAKI